MQVDNLVLQRHVGQRRFQFTARELSRWDVIEAHTSAGSASAATFPDILKRECPIPIKAIQVDCSSEFHARFEEVCERRGIKIFVLPTRSPKLNGNIERANRTHREEYYELTDIRVPITEHIDDLKYWHDIYNTVRTNQSLNYTTPLEELESYGIVLAPPLALKSRCSERVQNIDY